MRQKSGPEVSAVRTVKDIRRATRKRHATKEKIRIVLEGVARATFYRWCDLYRRFGEEGLEDRRSGPPRAWNPIPDKVRADMLDMALARPKLSPRELAVTFTDERSCFIPEASVYRLLKAHDLITSPASTVMKADDVNDALAIIDQSQSHCFSPSKPKSQPSHERNP